jgi:predicted amidophosphoribosyltransferase
MNVNISRCIHCRRRLHYAQARLLPGGGGVCPACAAEHGYRACEECQDYFIPEIEDEHFCSLCVKRVFERFI